MKSKTTTNPQKKKSIATAIYALIVGLLILACAIIIATVTAKSSNRNQIGDDEVVDVSATTFVEPMQGATIIKDYSGTKLQYNNTLKQWEIHKAVDFLVGENANVVAIKDGTVSEITTNHLEGTVIKIAHDNGLVSVYKSLDKAVAVSVGQKVSTGTVIGKASNTMGEEQAMGVHLHLEILKNGVRVDPNNYIALGNK